MDAVLDEPPQDPDDWTEEQWREWLANAPADPDTGRAHPLSRAVSSGTGVALGAAMLGLHEAIYGERPKAEVVVEAEASGADGGDLELDLDDPSRSRLTIDGDG